MPLFLAPADFVPRNLGWRSRFARRVFRVRSARFQNSSYSFFSQYGVLQKVRKHTFCQTGEIRRQWSYGADTRAPAEFQFETLMKLHSGSVAVASGFCDNKSPEVPVRAIA